MFNCVSLSLFCRPPLPWLGAFFLTHVVSPPFHPDRQTNYIWDLIPSDRFRPPQPSSKSARIAKHSGRQGQAFVSGGCSDTTNAFFQDARHAESAGRAGAMGVRASPWQRCTPSYPPRTGGSLIFPAMDAAGKLAHQAECRASIPPGLPGGIRSNRPRPMIGIRFPLALPGHAAEPGSDRNFSPAL